MCGIVGIVDFKGVPQRSILDAMLKTIDHRGPDSTGRYVDEEVALGVQRLSILDLITGEQPITNEDNTIVTVFNGELYNYPSLHQKLTQKGHRFKTKTDTEILVHLYEEYGKDLPKFLNGMFAFAIWDKKRNLLLLSRDQIGIKPLYYYHDPSFLIFGSELKTLLTHPRVNKKLDINALNLYSRFGFIPGPFSIFSRIHKLLPGHNLIFDRNGVKINKYWKLEINFDLNTVDLDQLLEKIICAQGIADVPVGVFLSGGIDSSLIAWYLSKGLKYQLQTFSVTFREPSFTEETYASVVARKLNTKHRQVEFIANDVVTLFPKIIEKLDEPLADPSLFPTYQISRFAAKYVKVVLSGDGGDEIFAGYPTYQGHLIASRFNWLPESLRSAAIKIITRFPHSYDNYPALDVLQTFLQGLYLTPADRQLKWLQLLFGDGQKYLRPNWKKEINTNAFFKYSDFSNNPVIQAQIVDLMTYLRDDLLVKSDRASMYNSLEIRVPFVDLELIQYAFSVQSVRHIDVWNTKKLLRKLAQIKFGTLISKRKKKGFGIPIAQWMRYDLRDFFEEKLKNSQLDEYFERSEIDRLFMEHLSGSANNARQIWLISIFSAWVRRWLN